MNLARQMKWKEYGSNVISHDLSYANNSELSNTYHTVRLNNTHRSQVPLAMDLNAEPEVVDRKQKTAKIVHARSKERLVKEKPLHTKVQRTSY